MVVVWDASESHEAEMQTKTGSSGMGGVGDYSDAGLHCGADQGHIIRRDRQSLSRWTFLVD